MRIYAYLTFNGNCRQAMTFYRKCLGGKLTFQTVGESPLSAGMPVKMRDCIVHATLTSDALVLMGSDMVTETGLIKGNTITLSLHCDSEEVTKAAYRKLSAGGRANYPLEITFWGALFGGLTDKFGHHWLLTYDKRKKQQKKINSAKFSSPR